MTRFPPCFVSQQAWSHYLRGWQAWQLRPGKASRACSDCAPEWRELMQRVGQCVRTEAVVTEEAIEAAKADDPGDTIETQVERIRSIEWEIREIRKTRKN